MGEGSVAPATKDDLLDRMRRGHQEWHALVARVPESAMTVPALGDGSSVKDLIAHVAAYEQWTAAQIRAASEGRPPTDLELYGVEELPHDPEGWDLDRQNAAIYARHRDMPLTEVRAFAARSFTGLVAAVEGVPEADFARPGAQAWTGGDTLFDLIPGQSYAHYAQHLADLRAIAGEGIG